MVNVILVSYRLGNVWNNKIAFNLIIYYLDDEIKEDKMEGKRRR
jgi:hypothetical protein